MSLCKGFSASPAVSFWHGTTTVQYSSSSSPRVFDREAGNRDDSVPALWNACDYSQSGGQGVECWLMWKLSLIWIKSWRLWRAHFAIIHGNFKASIIKLEEYLTKKQPQCKTERLVGRREDGGERTSANTKEKQQEAVCLYNIVREILRDGRKCWSPGAHEDLERKDACGESHATTRDHGHVRSFLRSPLFLNASEGKTDRLFVWLLSEPVEPGWKRLDYWEAGFPKLWVSQGDHTLLDFPFTPSKQLPIHHPSHLWWNKRANR